MFARLGALFLADMGEGLLVVNGFEWSVRYVRVGLVWFVVFGEKLVGRIP